MNSRSFIEKHEIKTILLSFALSIVTVSVWMRATQFWPGSSPAEILSGNIVVVSARRILTYMFLSGLDPAGHTFILAPGYIPVLVFVLAVTLMGLGGLTKRLGGSANLAIAVYAFMLIEHSIYGFRITSGNVGRMPGQITDFTAPLFFVALIWSWYERKWWAWFLAFVLGTFNRETTLALLPLAFSLSPVAGIATAATWAAIKWFLSWWMPGALGMHQFIANIAYLGTDIADPLAGLRYLAELVIGGVLPFFGVRLALRDKRLRFMLLAFPLYWAAIAVFGCIPELRVYNKLSVVTAVLFALHFGRTDSQAGA